MAVAIQAENVPMPVCSEIGVNQLLSSAQGTEKMITTVSENFVRGLTIVAKRTPSSSCSFECSFIWQSSHRSTSILTDISSIIMVTMLGDTLHSVNARMLGSDAMTRTNDSVVQSLLKCIQQLESPNVEMWYCIKG